MKRSRGRWWWVVVAGAAIAASGCSSGCARTKLDLTLHGGFGYVVNPDFTVEAGFMKSINTADCNVTQLGVDLKVDDGTIVSPTGSPLTFGVTNAVITFDGVGTSTVDLTGATGPHLKQSNATPTSTTIAAAAVAAGAGPGGRKQPVPRASDDDWRDLFWVPHTRLNYLDKPIDPSWRTSAVTGRVVLAGGGISAGTPSDGAAVNGIWEFRTTSANRPSYQQAISDRLHFRTSIAGGQIAINIADASGTKQIVVAPIDNRKTVGLMLVGRHASQMPIKVGDPLEHFCTFYQLLDASKRPPKDDRLIPYFLGDGRSSSGTGANAQPTPGYFCPGDWP